MMGNQDRHFLTTKFRAHEATSVVPNIASPGQYVKGNLLG